MSLLFNMLSQFAIVFLLRSKHLLISCPQSLSTVILEQKKIKSLIISTFSPICHEVMGTDGAILVFWMLNFKPVFFFFFFLLFSFTLIKRLFSSYSLSAIRVVSSAYLRLLIFLPAISIPVYTSSCPAFLMMYSAYVLNKQGDSIQPCHTAFPILNQALASCSVVTCFLPCVPVSKMV